MRISGRFSHRARVVGGILVAAALVPLTTGAGLPKADAALGDVRDGWVVKYHHSFDSLKDVTAFQSGKDVNSALRPSDAGNKLLQKPSVRSNVFIVEDSKARDGKALRVATRPAEYQTDKGVKYGFANGRMMVKHSEAPPVRIQARLKFEGRGKTAVMWWPSNGGWPWEVDFAETFGGDPSKVIDQRWHGDGPDANNRANEQIIKHVKMDGTQYHVYDLRITRDRMVIYIDGVKKFETTNKQFIPNSAGHFAIGKALTGTRSGGQQVNSVTVDWMSISKPVKG